MRGVFQVARRIEADEDFRLEPGEVYPVAEAFGPGTFTWEIRDGKACVEECLPESGDEVIPWELVFPRIYPGGVDS
jgi:hypothetical protein